MKAQSPPKGAHGLNYFPLSAGSKAFTATIFFSFEALNLSSSASDRQSYTAACALAGIDKHLGFHIQLHPNNPPANQSICRRLQKQGTALKWRWLRHGKAFTNCCWYPNMRVSWGDCAILHIHYPAGRNSSSTCRNGLSRVSCSAKLLTTYKWWLWSKMRGFPWRHMTHCSGSCICLSCMRTNWKRKHVEILHDLEPCMFLGWLAS